MAGVSPGTSLALTSQKPQWQEGALPGPGEIAASWEDPAREKQARSPGGAGRGQGASTGLESTVCRWAHVTRPVTPCPGAPHPQHLPPPLSWVLNRLWADWKEQGLGVPGEAGRQEGIWGQCSGPAPCVPPLHSPVYRTCLKDLGRPPACRGGETAPSPSQSLARAASRASVPTTLCSQPPVECAQSLPPVQPSPQWWTEDTPGPCGQSSPTVQGPLLSLQAALPTAPEGL